MSQLEPSLKPARLSWMIGVLSSVFESNGAALVPNNKIGFSYFPGSD